MNMRDDEDDLFADGIQPWARQVRSGSLSFRKTVEICLQRVNDNAMLNAFECLDAERALATAAALDALLASGTDLGPLMGLPMGVKDIMAVEGLPTTNGSNADTAELTGAEGSLIRRLRRAGMIPLGKTRTVEFALGATGLNSSRGTPWNPVDRQVHRIPGGSSSGSAVATACGMVGLGLGSDTGGSIRIPACLTGIVGYKSSVGIWPLDGIFPLSSSLDSAGPLCRTVADAVLLHTLLSGEAVSARAGVSGLRLGIVEELFQDDLDPQVAEDFERVCQLLERHGARRVKLSFPEVHERVPLFSAIVPAELINTLTPERFQAIRQGVDAVTVSRAEAGLATRAHEYVGAQQRRRQLVDKARATFDQVDLWLSPTCPFLPMPVADLQQTAGHERAMLASRNTQPGNLLDMCGLSLPMHGDTLPTGLQLTMPLNQDARLLSVGLAVERVLRDG
ncbi:amidase [Granulosicoccus sp. 3-233]|uniref:amidase n=1 Tax=Granulosicoccus sp. 3-233 TaxID=3417969 RepID=UPI003D33DB48